MVTVKKVFGVKSVVINNPATSDIEAEYIKAAKNKMPFYIVENGCLVGYGTFAIASYLGISDSSLLIKKINQ